MTHAAAAAPPEVAPTLLGNALAGLHDATMWIADHATDNDGHNDAVKGIYRAFCLLKTLEAIYGPNVVDDICDQALAVAERHQSKGVR